jgi:hypothetical protein
MSCYTRSGRKEEGTVADDAMVISQDVVDPSAQAGSSVPVSASSVPASAAVTAGDIHDCSFFSEGMCVCLVDTTVRGNDVHFVVCCCVLSCDLRQVPLRQVY